MDSSCSPLTLHCTALCAESVWHCLVWERKQLVQCKCYFANCCKLSTQYNTVLCITTNVPFDWWAAGGGAGPVSTKGEWEEALGTALATNAVWGGPRPSCHLQWAFIDATALCYLPSLVLSWAFSHANAVFCLFSGVFNLSKIHVEHWDSMDLSHNLGTSYILDISALSRLGEGEKVKQKSSGHWTFFVRRTHSHLQN